MSAALLIAAVIAVLTGVAHSYLGERYILIRLFRRADLPRLGGSDWFTRRTIRFAWHVTTVAWWGFALILWQHARTGAEIGRVETLRAVSITFLVSAVLSIVFVKGRHLSWVLFLAIAGLAWWATL